MNDPNAEARRSASRRWSVTVPAIDLSWSGASLPLSGESRRNGRAVWRSSCGVVEMGVIPCLGVVMARWWRWEVSDELWAVIEPMLPKRERRFRYPGPKRIDDRKTLQGVLFVLATGIQWEYLAQELGFGFRAYLLTAAGRGARPGCGRNFSGCCWTGYGRQTVWTSPVSPLMPRTCGPSGVEAAQKSARIRLTVSGRGSKHHVLTDAHGTLLRVSLTGGHRSGVRQL